MTVEELEKAVKEKNAEFLATSCKHKTRYYKTFGELIDLVKQLKKARNKTQLTEA